MKKLSLYVPVYSLTLLLSASLLFSVQPMFSKMILPLLGGTPQVWNTAMLFFQVMLLGGYAYAHGTTKFLSVRMQAIVHLILLAVFIAVLPFGIPDGWLPPVVRDPTIWQLSVMAITVGGPFFVLAGSAPMLSRWFSGTDHPDADNPYFLYGASNFGSMSALLAYPTIIEPMLDLNEQAHTWMIGYLALIAFVAFSALLAWTSIAKNNIANDRTFDVPVTWSQRMQWLILAFIPSSLMLGVTTFITMDIAAVPLLWIVPLALYVGTFIIVFARKRYLSRDLILTTQAVLVIALLFQMITKFDPQNTGLLVMLHLSLFFFCAFACHTELADSKPGARKLTEFYLIMSLGGALGGFFNAIIAPVYFVIPLEYALAIAASLFMRHSAVGTQNLGNSLRNFRLMFNARGVDAIFSTPFILGFIIIFATAAAFTMNNTFIPWASAAVICAGLMFLMDRRWAFALLVTFVLFFYPPGYESGGFVFRDVILQDRNFFGVMKVVDTKADERMLMHGRTNHGAQALDPALRLTPLSYYSKHSPINDAFRYLDKGDGKQNVAVIGLGVGVTACFQKQGRHFDFFEIDPDITAIAENKELFTFLSDCGSPYNVILGDGRLTLQKQPDHSYDLILLDAFSSDNIPAHLLTIEAIRLYRQKLKPDGILIFNISNNYLDIEPILAVAAKELQVPGLANVTLGGKIADTNLTYYPAHFFSFSDNKNYISYLKDQGWTPGVERGGVKLWTDKFSNILGVFENQSGMRRFKERKDAGGETPD